MKPLVIIPTYNEAENIRAIIAAILKGTDDSLQIGRAHV